MDSRYALKRLTQEDLDLMDGLRVTFGKAFDEPENYTVKPPSAEYQRRLLEGDHFIALVALHDETVVGGIAAYELKKFEQERSEIYLYDLAVAEDHRRQGIAMALIQKLKVIAAERGVYDIFVQADTGAEDQAAIALYSRLGLKEEVLHFDIAVETSR